MVRITETIAYTQGWKACEAGRSRGDNPYLQSGTQTQRLDWFKGFAARGEKGFDVSHLPRHPSGAFR